jgi:hypothetical protein
MDPNPLEGGLPSTSVFIDSVSEAFDDDLNVTHESPISVTRLVLPTNTVVTELVTGDDADDEFERLEARVFSEYFPRLDEQEMPAHPFNRDSAPPVSNASRDPQAWDLHVDQPVFGEFFADRTGPATTTSASPQQLLSLSPEHAQSVSAITTPAVIRRELLPTSIPLPSSMRARNTPWSVHSVRSENSAEGPGDVPKAPSPNVPRPELPSGWSNGTTIARESVELTVPVNLGSIQTEESEHAKVTAVAPLPAAAILPQPPQFVPAVAPIGIQPSLAATLQPKPPSLPPPPIAFGASLGDPSVRDPVAQMVRDRVAALTAEISRYQAAVALQVSDVIKCETTHIKQSPWCSLLQ